MTAPLVATIDFETDAIEGNPVLNPPRAVGVAVELPGHIAPQYLSWGHPEKNNCTYGDACNLLYRVWMSGVPLLFHHAKFDISVWRGLNPHFAELLRRFDWRRIHDTEYLIFFRDPYSNNLALKPSAERILGVPPIERDELKAWILAHVPGATAKDWAAHISKAPGDLAGRYAVGDIVRTSALFNKLYDHIVAVDMVPAYDRERRMLPITMEATLRGVPIDRPRMAQDESKYTSALVEAEKRLSLLIGVADLSDEEALKDGLERVGAVTEWVRTPKSNVRSLAEKNLKIVNPEIKVLMDYRGALKTCLQSFMRPWLEFSRADGRIHPNWNQVRQRGEDFKGKGARTGRLSSDSPSFMNVPTEWEYRDGAPMLVPPGLTAFPRIREYCLPEEGHLWLKRDIKSQEFRILAEYENGAIAEAFRADPDMDPHQMATEMLQVMAGLVLSRRPVKITGFSIVYGTGASGLADQLGVDYCAAKEIKDAYLATFPGVKNLMDECQAAGRSGAGIRTWGGRLYLAEPSKVTIMQGPFGPMEKRQDFFYKLLNYKVQGGAADQTKECINAWDDTRDPVCLFLATVHDEVNVSAPADNWQPHMAHLKDVIERDRLSVPVRTEGFVGRNWADLKGCE